jgi:[pyruvate, water dikinase]-phosphate phosphotransferase / [pyruvate, water dikinase] kinase
MGLGLCDVFLTLIIAKFDVRFCGLKLVNIDFSALCTNDPPCLMIIYDRNVAMKSFHLHLVSDATGETINSVARACVSQFDGVKPIEHFWNLVRTERQLDMVLEGIRENPGLVMFTLVNDALRQRLLAACLKYQSPCVPVLDPLIAALAAYLGAESQSKPGRQHALTPEYFGRISAMDFALGHDDGQLGSNLCDADVILVGVSRTSKTPTCIYLANRGVKAANIPFVPGCPLPEELNNLTRPLIVGLTKDPDRLIQIRRNRLKLLNQGMETSYTDPEKVRDELMEARRYYSRKGWPVIDVTRRSIEETAAEVMMMLSRTRPHIMQRLGESYGNKDVSDHDDEDDATDGWVG